MSYRDINRGPQLYKAFQERQKWQQKTPEQRAAAYRAVAKPANDRVKPEKVIAYLKPFNTTNANLYYETRGLAATQTGAGTTAGTTARNLAGTRIVYDAPTATGVVIINVPRYRFAKITVIQRTGAADNNAVSRITGRTYTRYRSESVSTPFGKDDNDLNYQDAIQTIKATAAYENFVATVGNRIGFTPEGN